MKGYISSEVETKNLRDIVAKAMGLPEVGINVGGGRHEQPGVTLYYMNAFQHPHDERWVMPVDDKVENIPNTTAQYSLLDQSEKDLLIFCLSNLNEITDDWYQIDLPTLT